jgi:hypothetical protein
LVEGLGAIAIGVGLDRRVERERLILLAAIEREAATAIHPAPRAEDERADEREEEVARPLHRSARLARIGRAARLARLGRA